MTPNPFSSLLHSRKFWLTILDAAIALVTLVFGRFLSPSDQDFALKIIALLQPVFVTIILAIAQEDVATTKAGGTQSGQYPAVTPSVPPVQPPVG